MNTLQHIRAICKKCNYNLVQVSSSNYQIYNKFQDRAEFRINDNGELAEFYTRALWNGEQIIKTVKMELIK
jgi:hypothetical protein